MVEYRFSRIDRHGSEYNVGIVFKNTRSGLVVYGNLLILFWYISSYEIFVSVGVFGKKMSEVSVGILAVRRCSIVPEIVENLHFS